MDLESTYRRYFPAIREKCRRMLGGDDADDIAQETFVKLWHAKIATENEARALAWIYRTSTRLAIDLLRQRKRRAAPEGELEMSRLTSPSLPTDDAIAFRRDLEMLVRALPADELEIALLHRVDELTQDEIAEVVGVSSRTVRRSIARFDERVQKLREEAAR